MKKSILLSALALVLVFGFIGCGGDEPEGNVLAVTGVPVEIVTAGVYADLSKLEEVAAVGTKSGNTFTFYLTGDEGLPDTKKPWKASGRYFLLLADGLEANDLYAYTAGNGKFAFNGDKKNVNIDKFSKLDAFLLFVSGDVPANIVGAAIREGSSTSSELLAVGQKLPSGFYLFYEPIWISPTLPMPNTTKPWSGDGEAYLVLSTFNGSQHRYKNNSPFDFSGFLGTADWADFSQ